MARLASHIWVNAYLRRLGLANIPAFIVSKGDETAGAVLVKSNTLDGKLALFHRAYDPTGKRIWCILDEGTEPEMDVLVEKQRRFDPDLWVIEVEDKLGRTLLDEEGLME